MRKEKATQVPDKALLIATAIMVHLGHIAFGSKKWFAERDWIAGTLRLNYHQNPTTPVLPRAPRKRETNR